MDYTGHGILQARIIEYWRGLPFPSPGDLPNPGFKPRSLTLQADALTSELPGKPSTKDKDINKERISGQGLVP